MKLRKISEPITITVFSKEEALDLLLLLHDNGYTWPSHDSLLDKNCLNNSHSQYYTIYPDKTVLRTNNTTNYIRIGLKEFKYRMEMPLEINIPKGYEIDQANSTSNCIKLKPKKLTYEDVEAMLLEEHYSDMKYEIKSTSIMQIEKLLAINKLMNVAKYLNGDWKPDWNNSQEKWSINIDANNNIRALYTCISHSMSIYFKTEELAEQAIEILGEDTIRLALSTDW